MRLASGEVGGAARIFVESHPGVLVDLLAAAEAHGIKPLAPLSSDMIALIEAGDEARDACQELLSCIRQSPDRVPGYAPEQVRWHPPVRRPSKLCCIALNNSANADRILSGPKHPAMFVKPWSTLIGHGAALRVRPSYGRVHPEPELAVVIGRLATEVTAADAMDHVYGYTIHNDFTSPSMRGEDTFHYRAIHPDAQDPTKIRYVESHVSYPGRYKCADTFSALGPWLVTRDEVRDPHDLDVRCDHQGRRVTQDNTANLFYRVPAVIEFISSYMTLMPGDVISMGTALKASSDDSGGMAVQNVDLSKLGGPVSVTITGLGTLETQVEWRP